MPVWQTAKGSVMMMSGILTRVQLGRVTRWVQTRNASPFSITRFKQCSSTSYPPPPSLENLKTLPQHMVRLTCESSAALGYCEVFLVGTLHYSERSCSEVQEIIKHLKPEVVFLELCSSRQAILSSRTLHPIGPLVIALHYKQNEFRVAYEEAIKYGGTVVLGDRPTQITKKRAWRKRPLSEIINCVIKILSLPFRKRSSLMNPSREEPNIDMETLTLFQQEIGEISPTYIETTLNERDLYMSAKLLHEAKKSSCIVAVVGMAHLPGIKKHWKQPVSDATIKDLLRVPPLLDRIVYAITLSCVVLLMFCVHTLGVYCLILDIVGVLFLTLNLLKKRKHRDIQE